MNKQQLRKAKNFDELLDLKYGKAGKKKRDVFERKAQNFANSEMLIAGKRQALPTLIR